jgi:TonB family protein
MPLRCLVLSLLLILTGTVPAAQPSPIERLSLWISEGRFKAAVAELQQISVQEGPSLRPTPLEEKVLRHAIDKARSFLREKHPPEQRDAARQALCLSRAYLPEELPGIEQALRVVGHPHRPELIGKPVRQYPEVAQRAGLQGTVIVEVVIDTEGCVRRPRILKGVPLGLDGAALAAVRSWTFQPATLDGRPVAVYCVLTVSCPARE